MLPEPHYVLRRFLLCTCFLLEMVFSQITDIASGELLTFPGGTAQIPFTETFEDVLTTGSLQTGWHIETTAFSRISVNTEDAPEGEYSCTVDNPLSSDDPFPASLTLQIDLSPSTSSGPPEMVHPILFFIYKTYPENIEISGSGLYISDDETNFVQILNFTFSGGFDPMEIDIREAAETHDMILNRRFMIRWMHAGSASYPTDALNMDNIHITNLYDDSSSSSGSEDGDTCDISVTVQVSYSTSDCGRVAEAIDINFWMKLVGNYGYEHSEFLFEDAPLMGETNQISFPLCMDYFATDQIEFIQIEARGDADATWLPATFLVVIEGCEYVLIQEPTNWFDAEPGDLYAYCHGIFPPTDDRRFQVNFPCSDDLLPTRSEATPGCENEVSGRVRYTTSECGPLAEAHGVNMTLSFITPSSAQIPGGETSVYLFQDSPGVGETGYNDFTICLDSGFQDRIQSFRIAGVGDDEWLPSQFIVHVEDCVYEFITTETNYFDAIPQERYPWCSGEFPGRAERTISTLYPCEESPNEGGILFSGSSSERDSSSEGDSVHPETPGPVNPDEPPLSSVVDSPESVTDPPKSTSPESVTDPPKSPSPESMTDPPKSTSPESVTDPPKSTSTESEDESKSLYCVYKINFASRQCLFEENEVICVDCPSRADHCPTTDNFPLVGQHQECVFTWTDSIDSCRKCNQGTKGFQFDLP